MVLPPDVLQVEVGPLASKIGEWAAEVLAPYLKRHPQNPHRESKHIHDPIGKAIALYPWEVYVVDSPILQRLRFIRQLGVGHFLFPTSGYSRFEHSLGCVQAASTLFDSVSSEGSGPAVRYAGEDLAARRDIVRLAALLHDTGHSILSHVSEKFYAQDPEILTAQKHLRRFYKNNVAPAEVVSILIIRSEAFQKLLAASNIRRTVFQDNEIIDKICSCIAGSKSRMVPDAYLAEIINGPVDCDKLDYLSRDAHMAGVPISLDIDRLKSKLRVVRTIGDDDKPIYSLAIVPSGARALEEMLVSRIFLYDKFYYHPKIMAAEEVVRRALHHLAVACPAFQSPRTLLDYADDEFLSLSAKYIADRYEIPEDDSHLKRGCELLARAKARDLPKRCFAFARRFIPEAPEVYSRFVNSGRGDNEQQAVLEFMQVDRLLEGAGGTELHARKLESLLKELGIDSEVFLGYQSAKRAAGKMDMPVKLSDSEVDPTPDFLFNVSKWSEAYALNKQTSFVFAYDHFAEVHVVAERFFSERGMEFAPKSWIFAKLSPERLVATRSTLPHNDHWLPHRLSPDYINSSAALKRLAAMKQKFATFLNGFDRVLGPALLDSWIWQFRDPDLQDNALGLLEHITFVEKVDIVTAFGKIATSNDQLATAIWIPLRPRKGKGASADMVKYDLKGVPVTVSDMSSLTPDEIRRAGAVVWFDDLLNTGVQAECLLTSWFIGDSGPCEKASDRDTAGILSPELAEAFRSVPVDFVFYSTHPSGIHRLRQACALAKLNVREVTGWLDSSLPKFTLEGFEGTGSKSRQRLVDYLQARGEDLLREKHDGDTAWTESRIRDFALGYGGINMTVVYRHSVSTAIPVAFWQSSRALNSPWLPLFPRKEEPLRALLDPDGTGVHSASSLPEMQSSTDEPDLWETSIVRGVEPIA